jgi:peptide chain release factor 2
MRDKQELVQLFEEYGEKLFKAKEKLDLVSMQTRLESLKQEMEDTNFWQNSDKATSVSQTVKQLEQTLLSWQNILAQIEESKTLIKESTEEELELFYSDFEQILELAKSLYLETLLDGSYDQNSAILSVICGTGGKDAQDFTQMLARMYLRYAEKQGFSATVIDETPAEEVGLKNISFLVSGLNAYGYLKNEHGVHRLVRLSSFNSGNTRETSFAMVDVIPEIELDDQVEIKAEDLRVDVFRASGAGGQHVNTTDSAVRITHLPTGLVVSSQNQKSQHQNKENAMKILYGKLVQLMQEKNVATIGELRGVKQEMSWGNQIRSYVLHPYKMVKDHRTSFESNNPDKVLDGEIQDFIEAKLTT